LAKKRTVLTDVVSDRAGPIEYWRRRGFRRMSAPRRPKYARLIVVDFVDED
jgi:hypothetical protein